MPFADVTWDRDAACTPTTPAHNNAFLQGEQYLRTLPFASPPTLPHYLSTSLPPLHHGCWGGTPYYRQTFPSHHHSWAGCLPYRTVVGILGVRRDRWMGPTVACSHSLPLCAACQRPISRAGPRDFSFGAATGPCGWGIPLLPPRYYLYFILYQPVDETMLVWTIAVDTLFHTFPTTHLHLHHARTLQNAQSNRYMTRCDRLDT